MHTINTQHKCNEHEMYYKLVEIFDIYITWFVGNENLNNNSIDIGN